MIAVGCMCITGPQKTYAASEIAIDETNFPDDSFRSYVLSYIDTDGSWTLSEAEIEAVTSIDIGVSYIYDDTEDLRGIEYFTNLEVLQCDYIPLKSLDVSRNIALEELNCCYTELSSLDVSKNTAFLNNIQCN